MITNDSKVTGSKAVTGGLAAMLAKKVDEPKNEGSLPANTLPLTNTGIRTEPPIEVEKSLPDDPATPDYAFRVFNHRYEFKIDGKVLKPDAKNIYTPTSQEEFDFLRLQVERGKIHFY